jgi:hypothetical protein
MAVGFELETGGHFFKMMVTNSVYLNPSTYLAGSDFPAADDQWRLGFIITRGDTTALHRSSPKDWGRYNSRSFR